jgi:hypothetical protein
MVATRRLCPQRGEFAPRALADEERVRLAGLHQVNHLIHQVEGQRATVGSGGEGLANRDGLGQAVERFGIDGGITVVEGVYVL